MKDYKNIWDSLSMSWDDATYVVCCIDDEDQIRTNGQYTANFLQRALQIQPTDKVLEIGCGVGRIGRELAPMCGEWHGADISSNMINYARERTAHLPNVHLYELPQSNLAIFQSGYFDCVYSTIVFMHLDKVEVFNYIREVYRLLTPGGRAYFDTYNLLAPQAWEEFVKIADSLPAWVRPGHVSQFSTPPEMRKYMEEAGFDPVHIDDTNPQLVVALGYKAAEDNVERPESAMNPNADMRTGAELSAIYLADTEPSVYNELMQVRQNVEAKNRYIEELERTLQQKNRHIEKLERLARRQQRKLDTVPGRIVVRLTRGR